MLPLKGKVSYIRTGSQRETWWCYLDGLGDQCADEVHEAQVCVAVSDQCSSGQRHAWFLNTQQQEVDSYYTYKYIYTQCECAAEAAVSDLQAVKPVPAVGGVFDLEELQDSDEHVGVVIRQRAGQQAVSVIQLDVEAATQRETSNIQSENTGADLREAFN